MINWILRKILIKISRHAVRFLGKLHLPYTRKKITGKHYYDLEKKLLPADVLFTTTRGELSNIINFSRPKHGGMYVGRKAGIPYVIEALSHGVDNTDLATFLLRKDHVMVLNLKNITGEQRHQLIEIISEKLGRPYDTSFCPDNDEYYCFELIIQSCQELFPDRVFLGDTVLGVTTYTAQSIIKDVDNWEIVYNSKETQ